MINSLISKVEMKAEKSWTSALTMDQENRENEENDESTNSRNQYNSCDCYVVLPTVIVFLILTLVILAPGIRIWITMTRN